ncbi:MAG TPA: glycosyl hydrolase family 88, partial [Lachnospiraceae bacterium]|nr:glycosyl hydrolase family 88 [Lachnospiraceae bacterium]
KSGMFWQVVDRADAEGNYLETSGTALIACAILKGVRLGYLPKKYEKIGLDAFNGIVDKYLTIDDDGNLNLGGICLVAGLGGPTKRDGSLEYYFSEPVVSNEAKGVAPFLLAYTEVLRRGQ